MTVPGNLSSPLLATAADAAAAAAGPIKSLRFNSGDSAYLSRTPSSASNRKTWTCNFWTKFNPKGSSKQHVFQARTSANTDDTGIGFENDQIRVITGAVDAFVSNAVFRDPSAFYNFHIIFDTTNSTASDRIRVFCNGVRLTSSSYTAPSQNSTWSINNNVAHSIGRHQGVASQYFDGLIAAFYLIDGSALEPTSFGAYDSNGVWQAAEYTGTFGTNGLHLLDFASESTVGHDSSGNENDFTANNITTGNTFSTNMTPSSTAYPNTTLSNGGLSWSGSTANDTGTVSSLTIPTNKKTYVEVTHTTTGGGDPGPGVAQGPTVEMGLDSVKAWWRGGTNGSISNSTLGSFSGTNTTWSNGDVLGIALDNTANSGAGSITFYKNGAQIHTGGSGWTSYTDLRFEWQNNGSGTSSGTWNYGASAFSYPVSGHTGLFEGSGADEDVLFDVPTNGTQSDTGAGGEVSGNYPVWNPNNNGGSLTLSNGNLNAANTGGAHNACRATVKFPPTGKWYYEAEITTLGGACCIGVENSSREDPELAQSGTFFILVNSGGSVQKYNQSGVTNMSGMGTPAVGGILQVAYDADADKVWFGLNNNWMGSGSSANGNPSAGTEASISNISDPFPVTNQSTSACAANFGQRSFAYSAPTNFKPLCTTLFPTSTVADGSDQFDTQLYTGNGGAQSIGGPVYSATSTMSSPTQAFNGDTSNGSVFNSTGNSVLTAGSITITSSLEIFHNRTGSDGITVNINGTNYVATGLSSNGYHTIPIPGSDLPLTSTGNITIKDNQSGAQSTVYAVRVDSNVLVDGTGESLSFSPDWVWIKRLNGSGQHVLTDSVRGTNKQLFSSNTNTEQTSATGITSFDSGGFSLGTNVSPTGSTNGSSSTYAAWSWNAGANSNKTYTVTVVSDSGNKYRFDGHGTSAVTLDLAEGSTYIFDQSDSSNAGHPIRFGTSANGTDYTTGVTHTGTPGSAGAKTTLVLGTGVSTLYYSCQNHSGMGGQINTNSTAGSTRLSGSENASFYNQNQTWSSAAADSYGFDGSTAYNSSATRLYGTSTYHKIVDADNPFTNVTSVVVGTSENVGNIKLDGTVYTTSYTSGVGLTVTSPPSSFSDIEVLGASNGVQIAYVKISGVILVDSGVSLSGVTQYPSINSVVKANPEAGFSIVTYTGTGSNGTVAHGLNAAPEMVILKGRSFTDNWRVYHKDLDSTAPANYYLMLEKTNGKSANSTNIFNQTVPTSSVFSLGTDSAVNGSSRTMVAYCFAPVAGYSATGSYTGSSSFPFVHCGFRPAFIILKKTSGADKWCMYDTARGTFNTLETQLHPNTSDAESGDFFKFDILSNGFRPMDTSGQVNENGQNYIFYAVAENPFQANGGLAR